MLAPTRELAAQIATELAPLAAARRLRVHAFYGGVGFEPQREALKRGVDIAVACPGRLADLVQQRSVNLGEVEFVVVDEADRMADMGFLPEVRRLLDATARRAPDAALLGHARRRRRRAHPALPDRSGAPRGRDRPTSATSITTSGW